MWDSLGDIAKIYNNKYRILRNKYKWSPDIVDKLPLIRISRIVAETIEDFSKKNPDGSIELMLDDLG